MKLRVLALVAISTLMFTACGKKEVSTNADTTAVVIDSLKADTTVADTTKTDTTVADTTAVDTTADTASVDTTAKK